MQRRSRPFLPFSQALFLLPKEKTKSSGQLIVDSYGINLRGKFDLDQIASGYLYINDQLSIINCQLLFRISGGVFQWKMENGTAGFRFSEQGAGK